MNLLAAMVLALASPNWDESPYIPALYRLPAEPVVWGAEHGRVLLRELRCGSCHVAEDSAVAAPPPAPNLNGLRHRMRADNLYNKLDPESNWDRMPAIVYGDDGEAKREALTHFLMSDDGTRPPPAQTADGDAIARGDALYHSIGCIACHEPMHEPAPTPPAEDDPFADTAPLVKSASQLDGFSVVLRNRMGNTDLSALTQFLLDPLVVIPDGRMPSMHLSETEARDIASYLLRDQEAKPSDAFETDPEKAAYGRQLFSALRCSACHARADADLPPPSPPWEVIANANVGDCSGPADYGIADTRMTEAMQIALAEPTAPPSIPETLTALNCFACHERDGLGGPLDYRQQFFTTTIDADLGDEGRLPPTLTGVGAKLTEDGLRGILLEGESVRPYMATRMPDFGAANVAHLVPMFLEEDKNPDAPATDVSGLEHHHRNHYGRQLMGTDGLSCITCHDLSGARSLGIPAIDLALTPGRIQPSWFKQYLLDPASLRPGTRMPAFFAEGKSSFPGLFGGDANKQIEALWIYLREIEQTRLPVGMEDDTNYELVPAERPIVLRTFMEGVGAQAIAVGFPQGVHVAFDARFPRFALAWTGKFIDAESTWADRFSPFAKPLGDVFSLFPDGPPVANLVRADAAWPEENVLRFRGYTLDADGTPAFLYQTPEGVDIHDRLQPTDESHLRRRLEAGPGGEMLSVLIARAPKLVVVEDGRFSVNGTTITLVTGEATPLSTGETVELRAHLPASDGTRSVEWEILW